MIKTLEGHCKDCKYWETHVDDWNKQWTTCEAVSWVDYAEKIPEDGLAIYADANDDSGLDAGLKTGPMFGCVKFSARKNNPA